VSEVMPRMCAPGACPPTASRWSEGQAPPDSPGETHMTTMRRLISSLDRWTLTAFNAPSELRSR